MAVVGADDVVGVEVAVGADAVIGAGALVGADEVVGEVEVVGAATGALAGMVAGSLAGAVVWAFRLPNANITNTVSIKYGFIRVLQGLASGIAAARLSAFVAHCQLPIAN
jgi:hypothetical protein